MLHNGASLTEIAEDNPFLFCRLHRGIERFIQLIGLQPRTEMTQLIIYQGTTGTGKSHRAHFFDVATWTHGGDRWFDGYEGQDVALFDDFDGVKSGVTYRKLLQLCDCYPLSVPVKGNFVNWRPRKVIITTNVEPMLWYPDEDFSPLRRRIFCHLKFGPDMGQISAKVGAIEEGPFTQ